MKLLDYRRSECMYSFCYCSGTFGDPDVMMNMQKCYAATALYAATEYMMNLTSIFSSLLRCGLALRQNINFWGQKRILSKLVIGSTHRTLCCMEYLNNLWGLGAMDEGRERDQTSRGGGLPTLPGLYHSTFQPSQRGFFWVHMCVWRERKPEAEFLNFLGPQPSIPWNLFLKGTVALDGFFAHLILSI